MTNPLGTGPSTPGGGDLKPGETRTIHARDKSGEIIKTIVVHRTARDYVYDLCDAYNVAMSPSARERGAQWYVDAAGELKLGDNAEWARHHTKQLEHRTETERARFIRHQLEHQPREAAE